MAPPLVKLHMAMPDCHMPLSQEEKMWSPSVLAGSQGPKSRHFKTFMSTVSYTSWSSGSPRTLQLANWFGFPEVPHAIWEWKLHPCMISHTSGHLRARKELLWYAHVGPRELRNWLPCRHACPTYSRKWRQLEVNTQNNDEIVIIRWSFDRHFWTGMHPNIAPQKNRRL